LSPLPSTTRDFIAVNRRVGMRSLLSPEGPIESVDLVAQRVDDRPAHTLGDFVIALHVLPRQGEIADNGTGQGYFETTDRGFQAAAGNDHCLGHGRTVDGAMVGVKGGAALQGFVFLFAFAILRGCGFSLGMANHCIGIEGVGWRWLAEDMRISPCCKCEVWDVAS
jgi:hypothetical protein